MVRLRLPPEAGTSGRIVWEPVTLHPDALRAQHSKPNWKQRPAIFPSAMLPADSAPQQQGAKSLHAMCMGRRCCAPEVATFVLVTFSEQRISPVGAAVASRFPAGERETFPAGVGRRSGDGMPAMSDSADMGEFGRFFDIFLWGAIRVDAVDQQKRLVKSIAPEYPDVARLAGIEGDVTLRIFVGRDGTIRDVVPVSGPPVLARAAKIGRAHV